MRAISVLERMVLILGPAALISGMHLAFPLTAEGQECVRNRSVFCANVQTYAATTYVAPAVAYNAIHVIEVPVNREFYTSLNEHYKAELWADAIIGRLELRDQLRNRKLLPEQSEPGRKAAARPTVPGADEPSAKLAAIVGNACIRCHSGAKLGGGLDLSDLKAVPEHLRYKASDWVYRGRMPKGGQPLPDEDAVEFSNWANGFKAVAGK